MTTPAPGHRRLFGGDPGGYDRARPDYPSRVSPGAMTVPLIVADGCGEWRTFVGAGSGA